MIKIKYAVESGDMLISVKGHANYGEFGKDIVCAGVSAIVQTALLGLVEIANAYPANVSVEDSDGKFVTIPKEEYDELLKDQTLLEKAINSRFD